METLVPSVSVDVGAGVAVPVSVGFGVVVLDLDGRELVVSDVVGFDPVGDITTVLVSVLTRTEVFGTCVVFSGVLLSKVEGAAAGTGIGVVVITWVGLFHVGTGIGIEVIEGGFVWGFDTKGIE